MGRLAIFTKMNEGDWVLAVQMFRPACPKGRDDRLFLEALRFFAVHATTWRALP